MKKLSKLHLRSEQYLTDSEMKLISGGADDENKYYDCSYNEAINPLIYRCATGFKCSTQDPLGGGYYAIKIGKCGFGFDSNGEYGCQCKVN